MLPDTLLGKANQLAEAYAKSQTCRLSAHLATSELVFKPFWSV